MTKDQKAIVALWRRVEQLEIELRDRRMVGSQLARFANSLAQSATLPQETRERLWGMHRKWWAVTTAGELDAEQLEALRVAVEFDEVVSLRENNPYVVDASIALRDLPVWACTCGAAGRGSILHGDGCPLDRRKP